MSTRRFLPCIIVQRHLKSSTMHQPHNLIEHVRQFVREEIVPNAAQFDKSGEVILTFNLVDFWL